MAGLLATLMDEDWEEAAAAEAVAARVASDTARFLPETTPLLLAAAAKATEADEVAASTGDSSDEEEIESDIDSDARDLPEGMASYDGDDDFGVALAAPGTTLGAAAVAEKAAAGKAAADKAQFEARFLPRLQAEKAREAVAEDAAAVRLQAAKRGQRARREVAGRRRQREGAQTFGSMTAVDESESSEEDDDDEVEEDDDDDFEEDDEV